MRLRIFTSITIITFVAAFIVTGGTLAWFTAKEDSPERVSLIVGKSIDLAITGNQTSAEPSALGSYSWEKDTEHTFQWTLENTGTSDEYVRARTVETFYQEAGSAWGSETSTGSDGRQEYVFPGPGWQTYFKYTVGENKEVLLVEGAQHKHVGTVEVQVDEGGQLSVKLTADQTEGYRLSKADLVVVKVENGDDEAALEKMPRTTDGVPIPGQFPWKEESELFLETFTFTLPLQGTYPSGTGFTYGTDSDLYSWSRGDELLIALHSDLFQEVENTAGSVDWELAGNAPQWQQGDDGYWYYCPPVEPGESVLLSLSGRAGATGEYRVTLEAEAIWGSGEAMQNKWTQAPCLQQ